ncbi:MAG: class I SAM-dependent rRNA methyltransferase [Hydrogenibacillus schlegelii]|nr:class I SAM-dependent rRNA methyltransferase [Hydrogenibacillus schlegelii]
MRSSDDLRAFASEASEVYGLVSGDPRTSGDLRTAVRGRVVLSPTRKRRLEAGHPWVFRTEVLRTEGEVAPGDVVDVVNHQGVFLARGFVQPASQIFVRVLTYDPAERIDADFFRRRIEAARRHRERFLDDPAFGRMVFGEADFLPGLIVDRFGDVLVVQMLSYGMDVRRDWIREALVAAFLPRAIVLRNDVPVREKEGLPQEVGLLYGEAPEAVEVREHGLVFRVDVFRGQKTGYFYDQRENRAALKPLMIGWGPDNAAGAEVLDCFSHTGAFAVHAAHYGARRVLAVDASEEAIALARENAARNGLLDQIEFRVGNCFDVLRELEDSGARFDVVILDPPAFAKSRQALEGALRGYKEINLRAMRLLREGGFLVTASCSAFVDRERFLGVISEAAFDSRKILRRIAFRTAAADHPALLAAPEEDYLKFGIFEVRSRGWRPSRSQRPVGHRREERIGTGAIRARDVEGGEGGGPE